MIIKVYKSTFEKGGTIKTFPEVNKNLANAEVERGESALINNELVKFGGQPHSSGGTPVSLPEGTRIYSEHLKVDPKIASQVLGKETKKKYSYAELSKRFKTKPYLEVLEDSEDEYQLEGARIKLANNLSKLDTLFYAQEQEKENKNSDNKKYQQGGWVTPRRLRPNSPEYIPQRKPTFEDYVLGEVQPMDYQQLQDYPYDYPVIHTEPAATVSTGVVLNLGNKEIAPQVPTNLQLVMPTRNESSIAPVRQVPNRSIKPEFKGKSISTKSDVAPSVVEDNEWAVPLPLDTLPQRQPTISSIASTTPIERDEQVADIVIENNDNKNYLGTSKEKWNFGISNKLAGTLADIGLALSDKLNVKEPTLYNRQKTPLFTRFVDFDDQDVARTFSLRSQQIQNSNMPEQVKQAQLSALNSEYQDYQAKVDFANLQRYEQKRELDTAKLQQYTDQNIDIKVEDTEFYNQRKANVDFLRDKFKAQRKARVVNALRGYANYADEVQYKNQLIPNYKVNPITGRIDYKPQDTSKLESNLLSQYQQSKPKIDLGGGAVGQQVGNVLVITDKDGKISTVQLND